MWKGIQFPTKNTTQPSNLFLNHWFQEILHKSSLIISNEIKDPTESRRVSSSFSKELSKFVHSSVELENKAECYSSILRNLKSRNNYNDDVVFSVAKFVMFDSGQFDKPEDKAELNELFGPVVWPIMEGRNITLKNSRFGYYLYIGEIPTRANKQKEVCNIIHICTRRVYGIRSLIYF